MVSPTETIRGEEKDIPVLNACQPVAPLRSTRILVKFPSALNAVGELAPITERVTWEPIARTWADVVEATPLDWSQAHTAAVARHVEQARQLEIGQHLDYLLGSAVDEVFENGMRSQFAQGLQRWVARYRNEAIFVLASLSVAEQIGPRLLAEALIRLGNLDDHVTYDSRFWLLAASLGHSSPEVRDAAGLGLAALGDRRAATYLRQAAEHEPIEELAIELGRVADYLTA